MDTLEYQALTDMVSNRGRFRAYEGESRGHFDIVCECKPTSAKEELSLGLVAQIAKTRRGLFCLEMVNSDARFFTSDQTDMIAFALRLVELVQGDAVNMLIDLVSGPVRLGSKHYALADHYDVCDSADEALRNLDLDPDPEPETPDRMHEVIHDGGPAPVEPVPYPEDDIEPEPEPQPAAPKKAVRRKPAAKRKTAATKPAIRKSRAKTPADLTFDDVL